jgi:ribosome biogenesis GTPase
MMKLSDLGFDKRFEAHASDLRQEGHRIARISAVDRGSYLIRNQIKEVPAELAGKFYFQVESSVDLPCVGDWVTVEYHNDDSAAIIHGVFPRKTFLRRKSAGEKVDFQMIAANIDVAFIVQSCHFDFNVRRMDRYLVMVVDGGVEPIVVLTKTDLNTPEELEQKLVAIKSTAITARVLALSNITGIGFEEFQQVLVSGRTYCLLGSSGVGKTTLINRLIGQDAFDTKAVSGTGEGIHTTARRQLIVLDQGAMLIDTPGMRELGLLGVSDGVNQGF